MFGYIGGSGGIPVLVEDPWNDVPLVLESIVSVGCDRTLELYHETDSQAAERILRSQQMLRGESGMAGGGIYVAESPSEARQKAHRHGVMLKADVRVGRSKEVHGAISTCCSRLQDEGYDSVRNLWCRTGPEHVVYNCGQVSNIRQL
ncbi:unnamed protein product [Effrenium voratum]|nr:unnamed protein product [Effrenium voratum]